MKHRVKIVSSSDFHNIEDINIVLERYNKNMICLEYCGNITRKSKFYCKICKNELYTTIDNLINCNCGCSYCSHKHRYTEKEIINKLDLLGYDLISYGGTIEKKSKIRHRKCGYEWDVLLEAIFQNASHCPYCNKRVPIKTLKDLNERIPNKDIICIEYTHGVNRKSLFKCSICGNTWYAISKNVIRGLSGCPICCESKLETEMRNILDKYGIKHERQKSFSGCRDKNILSFDFYLPDYNVCIEMDGKQHFEAVKYFGGEEKFKDTKNKDNIKTNYCIINNINIIRIPYFCQNNIEYTFLRAMFPYKYSIREDIVLTQKEGLT